MSHCSCRRNETLRHNLRSCSTAVCESFVCVDGCVRTCAQCEEEFCGDCVFGCEQCLETFCYGCRKRRGEQYCLECYAKLNVDYDNYYLDEDDEEENEALLKRAKELEKKLAELGKRKRILESNLAAQMQAAEQELKQVEKRRKMLCNQNVDSDSEED